MPVLVMMIVPVVGVMPMIVAMPVVVGMIVAAAAGVAMLVMLVMVPIVLAVGMARHGQRIGQCLLNRDGLLTGRTGWLDGQGHDLGRQQHVVRAAEIVAPQSAGTIEEQQRRRALHLVGGHRLRLLFAVRLVDSDRERPAVLMHERLQGRGRHDILMLEDAVQSN